MSKGPRKTRYLAKLGTKTFSRGRLGFRLLIVLRMRRWIKFPFQTGATLMSSTNSVETGATMKSYICNWKLKTEFSEANTSNLVNRDSRLNNNSDRCMGETANIPFWARSYQMERYGQRQRENRQAFVGSSLSTLSRRLSFLDITVEQHRRHCFRLEKDQFVSSLYQIRFTIFCWR